MNLTEDVLPRTLQHRLENDLILRAARRQPVERTPVWIMRQAGRYLPEYQKVRTHVDFLTLCKTPELASEVTIQPVDRLGVDAAIIFSDILVVPEAMGMNLAVDESRGPFFQSPLRSSADIERLHLPNVESIHGGLRFVPDAISLTKQNLQGRVPVIGFAGSPWTLAVYMIEGQTPATFRASKELIYNRPIDAYRLLEKLSQSVALFLTAQIEAGADLVQIFDTWGGILSPVAFREFSLRFIRDVIQRVRESSKRGQETPIILFAKGVHHSFEEIANSDIDVFSVDWTIDLGHVRASIGSRIALQGNLDPMVLHTSPEVIVAEVEKVLRSFGKGSGHIFNLGHGILPDTPVEHAKLLVDAVKEESRIFHGTGVHS